IACGVGGYPGKLGLVASIGRPGANATGVNFFTSDVLAKRLALLHDFVPGAARVAALLNPNDAPRAETVLSDLQAAARTIGVQLQIYNARTSGEIHAAFPPPGRQRAR